MKEYDIEKIRAQIRKKMGGTKDPTEFRAPKVEAGEEKHLRFFILPGYSAGDQLATGEASQSMDLPFIQTGSHFIENKVWGCPRAINDESCQLCDYAFDLMGKIAKDPKLSDEDKKKRKSDIARNFLSAAYKTVNIYFPDGKLGMVNPEELRGTVKWYNASTTIFNLWWECLSRDDDGGDELRPLPHGVFYNDEAAYLFDLRITKKGTMNSYEGSGFIITDKIRTMPIAFTKEGKPDREKIAEILARRHDLYSKIPDIDLKALARITTNLLGGVSSGSGGFDHDEERQAPPSKPASRSVANEVPVSPPKAPTQPKVAAPVKPVEEAEEPQKDQGEGWDDDVASLLAQIED